MSKGIKNPGKIKPAKVKYSWGLLFLIIPALILLIVFSYGPMYGVIIAFEDYSPVKGMLGSPWVGLKHFRKFVTAHNFKTLLRNTLTISAYSLIAGFPLPIVFALLVNKLTNKKFKKTVQTVSYAPYFISTVVLCGMIQIFFAPGTGIVNLLVTSLGGKSFDYLASGPAFKHIYVWTDVWKGIGWGSIIYVAALTNVSPELYESAKVDGATTLQTIFYIDIPSILPTIITLLILNTGHLMSVGFEKAYLLQNTLNREYSEIISTYVYKTGLTGKPRYSFSAMVGLFNSVINLILLASVNTIAKRVGETSLW